MISPRYPIFIPSRGRWQAERALTARALREAGVPFKLVVEPLEADHYAAAFGVDSLIVLPRDGMRAVGSRRWIQEHATGARHWQLDDNMRGFYQQYRGKRIRCPAGVALRAVEDFTDRYDNVGLSGPAYKMFGFPERPPFQVNCHGYSCMLINNSIQYRFRTTNEDIEMCLQLLAGGWCTLLVNAFQVDKMVTMSVPGGNTDDLYQGDGRFRKALELAALWPGVATVRRRYGRPQAYVPWGKLGPALRLNPDAAPVPDYGLRLVARGEVQSPRLKRLLDTEGNSTNA